MIKIVTNLDLDHNSKDKRFTKRYNLQEQKDFQESTTDTQIKDG